MQKIYLIDDYEAIQRKLNIINGMSDEQQRCLFFLYKKDNYHNFGFETSDIKTFISQTYNIKVVCIYEDKITFSYQTRSFYFNKRIYSKAIEFKGFTYYKSNKKIKLWNCNIAVACSLLKSFLLKTNVQWFNNMPYSIKNLLTTKTLCEGILSGKITNPEDFVKKWIKTSLRTPIYYRLVYKFLTVDSDKSIGMFDRKLLLYQIIMHVDNPNAFLDRIIVDNLIKLSNISILNDVFFQCSVLNKKIKWNWSENRLNNEHINMSREITMIKASFVSQDKIPFYGELSLPKNVTAQLIDSESMALIEGNEQVNCIYSNYWSRIQRKEYFVLSCTIPERCSIGIKTYGNVKPNFVIDQIYAKRNTPVKKETQNLFQEWITNEKTQEFFTQNYKILDDLDTDEIKPCPIMEMVID